MNNFFFYLKKKKRLTGVWQWCKHLFYSLFLFILFIDVGWLKVINEKEEDSKIQDPNTETEFRDFTNKTQELQSSLKAMLEHKENHN